MDLQQQQQMFLNAWLRPTLLSPTSTNTTTIINSQQQNVLQNIPENLRGTSSSSSSSPYNNNNNNIIRPPQQQQQLIIRHAPPPPSGTPLRVFEPSLASPSSLTSSSIPSFSSPSSLNNSIPQNQQIFVQSIPSQQQQYPQQFDHLVALATFQQMLERIKASETAKASQLANNQINSTNFGGIPTSAFKLVNSIQNSEINSNKTSIPYFLSEESVQYQQRQLEAKQQILQKIESKNDLKHQQQISHQQQRSSSLQKNFVPKPSTSADELLGQALIKLLQQQQTKGETTEINGNIVQTNIEGGNNNQTNTDYGSITACEEVLLCKVCSDRASGFHYGIFSCEGCKGFFRRSLQNKIDYRPCTQSQKCQIVRANRNRCQECRWRKCIEAGMSKDGVRYGRVPKREKEKLREEMRRDSVRSILEHLSFELNDEERLLEKLEKGWKELENDLKNILKNKKEEKNEEEKIIDINKLCLLAKSVVRFAENIGGFRLLRIDDQAQVLKESLFPVLLLRFCSLRLFSNNNDKLFDLANIPLALLLPTSSFSALRECTVEFIIRIREAHPPIELALTDKQLAICAAICLCRLEGAGECASGGTNTATTSNGMTTNTLNAWDEQSDQLGQAVCRRIREKFCKLLNYSLGVFGPEQQPTPVVCQFGPALLRTDLLIRQNLASVFERLKNCKELYSQFLNANTCKNIPSELFSLNLNEEKLNLIENPNKLIENNRKRKII
ncbi:hypothetical protein ACQ4LE_003546, partial [Meloidogyne hapla]